MNSDLLIIYGETNMDTHGEPGFFIANAIKKEGLIVEDELCRLYENFFSYDPNILMDGKVGVFKNIVELKKYSYELAESLELGNLYFISIEQFNGEIAKRDNSSDLIENLLIAGEKVEIEQSSKGLLSRFKLT